MPRRKAPFVPGQYYHFYNRGNNRQAIFFERDNYLYFLKGIKKYLRLRVEVLAYCLMPTHYHLLGRVSAQTSGFLKNPEVLSAEVSQAMMKLGVSYTKAINKRFSCVGALMQGQFQAKLIQTHAHLLNLCVYIHANPVKDGLVASPEAWEFSNYLEWLGLRSGTLIKREFIEENFETSEAYRQLVLGYLKTRKLAPEVLNYIHALENS